MIDRRKRSKILSEVKPVKNICKSPQSLLEVIPVKKGVLLSHKPQDHVYEWVLESFRIKGRYPVTKKFPESFESSNFVTHTARMSGEFDSRKDLHSTKF